tara:strand:+ start:18651 stop:19064 length:414 start_codon:yes stop_codon:yes gene_type:complete
MTHALLDIITGEYTDGEAIGSQHDEEQLLLSVRAHLMRLLNTRQGSLPHAKDYGLPDINMIYQGLPNAVDTFLAIIKQCVEKYEPRLQNVQVMYKPETNKECVVCLEINGRIKDSGSVRYATFFMSGGGAKVEEKRY